MSRSKKMMLCLSLLVIALVISFSLTNKPLAQQTVNYVGPNACSTCHSGIHTKWQSSNHSQMISNLTTELLASYGINGSASDPKSAANHSITVGPNFPFTIGGNWKLRFLNATAAANAGQPNNYSLWTVAVWQYIIATGEWQPYHAPPDTPKDWGSSCAQCHVTGFDSATETFWGTIDQLATSVSCESCHGPAELHIANPSANKLIIDISGQGCGQCHVRGSFPEYVIGDPDSFSYTHGEGPHRHHQQFYDWNISEHAEELETFLSDSCLSCKSTDNIFNTDLITFLDITMTAENATNPVTCISCHSGHDLDLWITRPPVEGYPIGWTLGSEADLNTVCMQCHTSGGLPEEIDHFIEHGEVWHHAQTEMFNGSIHYVSDVTCSVCHMALDTKSAVAYDLHNHTMIVNSFDTYAYSCGQSVGCHQDRGTTWAEQRVEEIQTTVTATLEKVENAMTLAENAIDSANQTTGVNKTAIEEAEDLLLHAKSYLSFVEADGSLGFHNPTYALSSLNTALDYAIQAQSTASEAKSTALTSDVTTLTAQVSSLETQVTSLQNQTATLQDDITNLETKIDNLESAAATVPYLYAGMGLAIGFIVGAAIIFMVRRGKP